MKKCFIFTMFAFLLLGASFSLFACKSKHEHVCSQWTNVVDATCTSEGSKTGICDKCGKEFTIVTEKLPHDFDDWVITIGATCQNEGERERECQVCGFKETEILAKAHSPQTIIGYDATCVDDGKTDGSKCTVCGEWIVEQKLENISMNVKSVAWFNKGCAYIQTK